MAIIDSEKQTQLLRKKADNIFDYEAMKLPVSELRISDSSNFNSIMIQDSAMTPDMNNICTWSIPIHSPAAFVQVREISTDDIVIAPFTVDTELRNNVSYYTLNIYIKSSNNIPENTYKAVIIG